MTDTAIHRPRATLESPQAWIFLQPLAAPAVLGYFALGSALIIWGSWFAQGWGTEKDASSFFPFLLLFARARRRPSLGSRPSTSRCTTSTSAPFRSTGRRSSSC